ncbi:MAG: glycosyltransferase [Acidobacteriaceae bacterium]|nr:glycosyltransferase [Acidobacteriaceae bacterium]
MKRRCLIFIVAYHAETTIDKVVRRIPVSLADEYDVDILIIDDSSRDRTFEKSYDLTRDADIPFNVRVLFNPVNQGYGGNQKLGYRYAIEHKYDFVALLHGDGQYAPEYLPQLLAPLHRGDAAAVFGSRMMTPKAALRGGMPMYKYVGNKVLTWIQNRLLRSTLTEFHSGYRTYSVEALKSIPFEYNANDFHFDTEIIIQLMIAKLPIIELPIPTFYGDEICRVNGLRYAANVIGTTIKARVQELSLFYDRKYDCAPAPRFPSSIRFSFDSPQSFALRMIPDGSRVIELGYSRGEVASALKQQKDCFVAGVAGIALGTERLDRFYLRDLNEGFEDIPLEDYDFVLLLDILEHLARPEAFLDELREKLSLNPRVELVISTGNVAFIVTRLMLLVGQFNYSKCGILDLTHTRLFTFSSLAHLLDQAGFDIYESRALPAPFPLAIGNSALSRLLSKLNSSLIRISPRLFGYQMIVRVKARPTVTSLLRAAEEESAIRREKLALQAHSG